MASLSTLSFLKSRLYAKLRLFNVKFHFGHKISILKSRLYCILDGGSLHHPPMPISDSKGTAKGGVGSELHGQNGKSLTSFFISSVNLGGKSSKRGNWISTYGI